MRKIEAILTKLCSYMHSEKQTLAESITTELSK